MNNQNLTLNCPSNDIILDESTMPFLNYSQENGGFVIE